MPHDEEPAADPPPRPLRRDAQRNRDALLAAARKAFAEDGLDTPLEAVARRAGVAIGTLYRHFPARIDLVQSVFADKLQRWSDATDQALAMDDAWQGFAFYLEKVCRLQALDRGLGDLASARFPRATCMDRLQASIHERGRRILARAQEQGAVRSDITHEDMAYVIWAQTRISEATRTIAPRAWRRHLDLMLDAFRADRAHSLSEPPLTPDEVYRAMVGLGGGGACAGRSTT